MRALWLYGAVAAIVIALDQWIKALVEAGMALYETIPLLPFLALHRTHNTGVAFSMFADSGGWGLIVLTAGVTGFILWLALRSGPHQHVARLGFALIVGGALGNLIDRLRFGHVVDYVLFYTQNWSFAVFNLADAAITVGAGLVILQEVLDWLRERRRRQGGA